MLAKKGRRAAATALALIMTLGTLPSAAFAAPERDHEHNAFNDDGFYYDCSYTEGEDEEVQVCDEAPNVHIHDDSCEVDEETGEYLCDGADNTHEHGAGCFGTQSSEGIWDCVPYPYYTITFTDEESGHSADARLVPEAPEFSEEIPDFEAPEGMTFDGWRDADGDWADPMELTGDAQLFAAWTGGETPEPETNVETPEATLSSVSNEFLTNGETLNITLSGVTGCWKKSPGLYDEGMGPTEDITVTAQAGEHISPESLVIAPVVYRNWYFLFNGEIQGMYHKGLGLIDYWDEIDYFFLREENGEPQLWAKYGKEERQITNPAEQLRFLTDWPYTFIDLGSTGVEYAYAVHDQTVVEMITDRLYCFNNQDDYERALRVNPELSDSIVRIDKGKGVTFFVKASQGYFPVAGEFTDTTGSQRGEIFPLNGATASGIDAEALSQGYSHKFYYHEFDKSWNSGHGIRGFRITAEKDDTEYTVTYHDGDKVLTDLAQKGTWNTELTIAGYTPGGGMVLVGWSTMPDGDVRYHAGDKYTVMGENLDLYAVLERGTEPGVPNVLIGIAAPPNAKVGEPFTYTLRVCNDGTAAADGVVLHDVIPAGLTLAENTLSAGQGSASYDTGDRTLTWTVGTLAAQNEKPLSELTWTELTFNVTAQTAGEYTNTVTLPGTKKTASVTTKVTEQTQPVENVTLRYYWNDGVHSDPVETKIVPKGEHIVLRDGEGMTRAGYTFLGWAYEAEAESPDLYGGWLLRLDGDTALHAVWTPRENYPVQFFLRLDSTIQKEDGTTQYSQVYYTPHKLLYGTVYDKSVSVDGAEQYITQGIEKNDLSELAGMLGPVKDAIRTLPDDQALRNVIHTYFDVTEEELNDNQVGVLWYVIKDVPGDVNCPYHVDGVLYRLKENGEPGPVLPKETSIQVVHEYWQAENGGPETKVGASPLVTVDTYKGAKIVVGQQIDTAQLDKVTTFDGHDDYSFVKGLPESLTVPADVVFTVTLKYIRKVDTFSVGGEKVVTGLSSLPQGYSVTLALKNGDTELDTVTLTAGDFTRMDDGSYRANFLFQARVEAGTYTIQETSGSSVGGYNGPAVSYQLDEYVETGPTHTNTNQVTVGGGKEWSMVVTNAYTVITSGDPGRDDNRDDDRNNDRDTTNTKQPSETPTPEVTPPAENGEVIIPDEEVPLTDLPQEETIIEEPQVPLADTPDEDTGTVILDEGTPLGNLPQTGTTAQPADPTITLGLLAVSVSLAAAGLWLLRKREDGEA